MDANLERDQPARNVAMSLPELWVTDRLTSEIYSVDHLDFVVLEVNES